MPSKIINKDNKKVYEEPHSKWPLLLQLTNHVSFSSNAIAGAVGGEYFVLVP